ncbi:MAG: hypothetical protein DRI37_04950 [Chloroflexi bacterium]|nr:MAG: hypothetical protein DRI37_04950 [Chloroflexota bacterium]
MLITLTTDFGTQDGYVGVMKGVMADIMPGVTFVDISHAVPPQDVRAAAYLLWTALPYFPAESIHLVVVDPGVGTARRPLASRTPWGLLVGPDNGVFSYVWAVAPPEMTVELTNPAYRQSALSSTFHGRDIFAPAAAYLARGVPLENFGALVAEPVRLSLPHLELDEGALKGEVLYVDHFGNAITSIGRLIWEGAFLHLDAAFGELSPLLLRADSLRVVVAEHNLGPVRRTYGEVASGAPLALVGSEGMLELAVSHGHGATVLGLQVGDEVQVLVG